MPIFPNDPGRPNPAQLRQFMNSTSPQQARAQVEAMLNSGKMTMEQFNELGRQATELMRQFGIK